MEQSSFSSSFCVGLSVSTSSAISVMDSVVLGRWRFLAQGCLVETRALLCFGNAILDVDAGAWLELVDAHQPHLRHLEDREEGYRRVLVNHYMNAWSLLPWTGAEIDGTKMSVAAADVRKIVPESAKSTTVQRPVAGKA